MTPKRPITISLALSISVLVSSIGTSQTVQSHQKVSDLEGGFAGVLKDTDQFGRAVTILRDLDGNGARELAVGAPGTNSGGLKSGAIWILFRNTDGSVAGQLKIDEGKGGFTGVLDYTDAFGSSLACLGDLDGDGNEDLAVGVPSNDGGLLACGAVLGCNFGGYWVLFMNPDGSVKAEIPLDLQRNFGAGISLYDHVGLALAPLGDLDGDGVPDLAVGTPGANIGGRDTGGLFVVLQLSDGRPKEKIRIAEGLNGFLADLVDGSLFGFSIANIGDLDDDGVVDLAVGAPSGCALGPPRATNQALGCADGTAVDDGGAVWILFMNADGSPGITLILTYNQNSYLCRCPFLRIQYADFIIR